MVCNKCNHDLIWQSDFMPDEYGFENIEGIVAVYYCPQCDDLKEFLITDNEVYLIFYDVDGSLLLLA